jgi:CDGSH-type Zn-finger protein
MKIGDKIRVKVMKNGPYIVSGNVPLYKTKFIVDDGGFPIKFDKKEKIETGEKYTLCRCGNSKNKPFCDGTHAKIDFDGEETAALDFDDVFYETFENDTLKLKDYYMICDHSRFCQRLGGLRPLMEENTPESNELAKQEAHYCPSGRLTIVDKETGESTEPEYEKEILIVYDPGKEVEGPIWLRGGIVVESADGQEYTVRNRITLCQCGKSWNKPFCNGNHWTSEEMQDKYMKKWDLYNKLEEFEKNKK